MKLLSWLNTILLWLVIVALAFTLCYEHDRLTLTQECLRGMQREQQRHDNCITYLYGRDKK
jgi:hypothetical protein